MISRTPHTSTARRISKLHSTPLEMSRCLKLNKKSQIAQEKVLATQNRRRQVRRFSVGEKVLMIINKKLGNKLTPPNEKVNEEDLN